MRLFQPTNDPRNRPLGAGVLYYVLLHGIVQHDAYHAGQIAILKKRRDQHPPAIGRRRRGTQRLLTLHPHQNANARTAGDSSSEDIGPAVGVEITAGDEDAADYVGFSAKKLAISVAPLPVRLRTRTCGPPPGPAPVIFSARPSPSMSPAATETPPENRGS